MKKYSQYHKDGIEFFVRENSWLARVAARKLRSDNVAIVMGDTIHLWNTDTQIFLSDEKWLRHELCHIRQFKKYGKIGFVCRYLLESLKNGYVQNKYETEARRAEQDDAC